MDVEKYYENDRMAVLISPEIGGGWSTWAMDKRIAYDRRVVEYFLNNHPSAEDMEEYLISIGYENPYVGCGYSTLRVEWVPKGTYFVISDYDGYESLIKQDEMMLA